MTLDSTPRTRITRRSRTAPRRRVSSLVTAAFAAAVILSLGGCAKAGADTTCKDFLGMSSQDQTSQVSTLYKDKHGSEPAALAATALQQEAIAYCNTAGRSDSKIKEIPIS
ncbi:hypothetical protein [Tsukamurella soli]|uniref:Acid stress chaperone HdeA n=1 Tax=Tsukamurella soli TaxID=644556 RepID=A0ABP8J3G4_9ACTN